MRLGILLAVVCVGLSWPCRAGDAGAEAAWVNPWRTDDGGIREGCLVVASTAAYASLADDEPADCPPFAIAAALRETPRDDNAHRHARLAAARARMLRGPEAMLAFEPYSTGAQRGVRLRQGAVVPLTQQMELAAMNYVGLYRRKHDGADAGIESLSIRLGAAPAASLRSWVAVTPYAGLGDSDAVGLGLSGGLEKHWDDGGEFAVAGYAFEAWDEGFETVLHDGRRHGVGVSGSLPVGERLTLSASAGYEWLETGPHAPTGGEFAGKRGEWTLRGEYALMEHDGAGAGYGFRDAGLWREDVTRTSLLLYADLYGRRYVRPDGFAALEPVKRSFRQRVGVAYSHALSPRLGLGGEAYVGQDTGRGLSAGELYGASVRLTAVVSPRLRVYLGWRYDASGDSLIGDGGPERYFFMGLHGSF